MSREVLQMALAVLKGCLEHPDAQDSIIAIEHELAQPDHPEQMARLGWQYVECPACGSEGARAFPKPEQAPVAKVVSSGEYGFPVLQWLSANHSLDTAIGSLLYTSPPQRQPLTDAEIDKIELPPSGTATVRDMVRLIEAAHDIGDKT